VRKDSPTQQAFAERCRTAYAATHGRPSGRKAVQDDLKVASIEECLKRLQQSRFLVVGRGKPGAEATFLGVHGRSIGFDEFSSFYKQVDRDHAREWAARWTKQAEKVVDASPEWIENAAAVYLATQAMLKKYGTDTVTMNCLGGFASGRLPAYPCLGFTQLLGDGGHGVCEAQPDDTVSMLIARYLTGRAGYVSDPTIDTSTGSALYAHCLAPTKVLGTDGPSNPYRIRLLHNRDPRGTCVQSLMPAGYMTTSFRTNHRSRQMVIHQARASGNLQSERGCRSQLVAEVQGDIDKLFRHWGHFGWHRVTVYGDIKDALVELAGAMKLKVVLEA
jgi:L-fucose isomerase-like protein